MSLFLTLCTARGAKFLQNKYHKYNIKQKTTVSDISGWATSSTGMPTTMGYMQSIIVKDKVYTIGGYNGSSRVNTIYVSNILEDGSLEGFSTYGTFPILISNTQVLVVKNKVFTFGGYNNSAYINTVYSADILEDGSLGTFVNTNNNLPSVLEPNQACVTKTRVYILGGYTGAPSSSVYYAPINSDGTLGTWVTDTNLPGTRSWSQAIITKSRVYCLGGHNGSAYDNKVYSAPIDADGVVGAWITDTALPATVGASQAVMTKNRIYLLGGLNGSADTSACYTAPIDDNGIIGTWTSMTSLPAARTFSTAIVTKSKIYLLGGSSRSGYYSSNIEVDFADGWKTNTTTTYIK